ncbi:tyrosine-type recombinase/integrase [Streptomyces sp. NBC_01367]|uniref:tyrosine-type recombinase/integrase n=1 Tax=Streptomyces sp. NBC_01367 TaxID=2903841 RepID=UPI003247F26E
MITFPKVHPVIGLADCPVPNCPLAITVFTHPMCRGCLERWRKTDLPLEEFRRMPKPFSTGAGQQPCAVSRCERPRDTAAAMLCVAHRLQQMQRLGGIGLEEFLAHPRVVGLAGFGPCWIAAYYLDRVGSKYPYCKTHTQRLRVVREERGFDEAWWRRTERAVCSTREVSLRGLPDLLVAEALYTLWSRIENGYKLRPEILRPLYDRMRALQVTTLEQVTAPEAVGFGREHATMIRAAQVVLGRLNSTPETERVKDVWDMAVFGHTSTVPFTAITQPALREAMKVWAYDDLPRRRNKNAVHHTREIVAAVAMLSESLRLQRTDRGEDPTGWGRVDIVAFTNRMGHLTASGKMSASRRLAFTRFVRRVLLRFRTLGLAGPGGLLEGMPVDFALWPEDMPDEPEDTEAGRDLPEEVMRALCANLDLLEQMSTTEVRVATELLIDTGRRPDEIYTLKLDCLETDPDGSPVLIYDNHKAYRLGRRLPIGGETAEVIRRQQQRVRARFPDVAPARLKLLPRPKTNPEGTKPVSDIANRHRKWVDSLPDLTVPVITTEAGTQVTHLVPFDKARIFTYAYRHCYAQRHADAGVPPDVLKELMDHQAITTTQGYYRNPQELHQTGEKLQVTRSGQDPTRTLPSCNLAA